MAITRIYFVYDDVNLQKMVTGQEIKPEYGQEFADIMGDELPQPGTTVLTDAQKQQALDTGQQPLLSGNWYVWQEGVPVPILLSVLAKQYSEDGLRAKYIWDQLMVYGALPQKTPEQVKNFQSTPLESSLVNAAIQNADANPIYQRDLGGFRETMEQVDTLFSTRDEKEAIAEAERRTEESRETRQIYNPEADVYDDVAVGEPTTEWRSIYDADTMQWSVAPVTQYGGIPPDEPEPVNKASEEYRITMQDIYQGLSPEVQQQHELKLIGGAWQIVEKTPEEQSTMVTQEINRLVLDGDLEGAEALDAVWDKLNQKRMTQSEAATIVAPYATNPQEFATWMRGLISASGQTMPAFAAASQSGQPGLFQPGQTSIVSDEVRALGEARLNAKEKYIQDQIDKGATPAEIDAIRKTPVTQLPVDLSLQPQSAAEVFTTGPFAQTMAEPGERMEGDPLIMGSGDRPTTVFKDPSMGTGVAPESKLLTYDPSKNKSLIMDENIRASMPTPLDDANELKMISGLPYITKGKGGAPGVTFVPNAAKILAKTQSQVVKDLRGQGATQAEIKAAQERYQAPGGKKIKYNPAASTKERIQGLMDEFGYTRSQAERYDFEQGKRRYKMHQSYLQQGPIRVRYG
jgi:hypothetical protein